MALSPSPPSPIVVNYADFLRGYVCPRRLSCFSDYCGLDRLPSIETALSGWLLCQRWRQGIWQVVAPGSGKPQHRIDLTLSQPEEPHFLRSAFGLVSSSAPPCSPQLVQNNLGPHPHTVSSRSLRSELASPRARVVPMPWLAPPCPYPPLPASRVRPHTARSCRCYRSCSRNTVSAGDWLGLRTPFSLPQPKSKVHTSQPLEPSGHRKRTRTVRRPDRWAGSPLARDALAALLRACPHFARSDGLALSHNRPSLGYSTAPWLLPLSLFSRDLS